MRGCRAFWRWSLKAEEEAAQSGCGGLEEVARILEVEVEEQAGCGSSYSGISEGADQKWKKCFSYFVILILIEI